MKKIVEFIRNYIYRCKTKVDLLDYDFYDDIRLIDLEESDDNV